MQSGKRKAKSDAATAGHVTKGDLFDDLGFSPEETLEAKIKADIWLALMKEIEREGLTQSQLAAALLCHQPDVSNLLNGKISRFSITKLLQFAGRLDMDASVTVKASKVRKGPVPLVAAGAKARQKRDLVGA